MEGEFQDQGQLDQDLEEWLSPRGSQSVHGFFSEEDKQESIQTEDSAPEGARIINQAPEVETSTVVVVKCSDKVEGSGDDIDSPLCGGLYKEEKDSLVSWSGTDPDAKMNCFTFSKENNDWIFQKTNRMKNIRTGEELYTMVNFVNITSRINKRQRINAPSMKYLPSLMEFPEKEIQKYPSSSTRINAVSI